MSTQPRIGFIIPASNRLAEPQFHTYAPAGVGVHFSRLRMTGKWRKPLAELKPSLAETALALSDISLAPVDMPRAIDDNFSDDVAMVAMPDDTPLPPGGPPCAPRSCLAAC